jgi:hypothetical protein
MTRRWMERLGAYFAGATARKAAAAAGMRTARVEEATRALDADMALPREAGREREAAVRQAALDEAARRAAARRAPGPVRGPEPAASCGRPPPAAAAAAARRRCGGEAPLARRRRPVSRGRSGR